MSGDAYWHRGYFVRPEEVASLRLDLEWCAAAPKEPVKLVMDPSLAHIRAMPSIGPAIAEATAKALRENPPPPDALLPEGYTRWVPRLEPELEYREDGVFARFTWEAKP